MQVGKRMMDFDFNPRSPHGERREAAAALRRGAEFQSTLPARGATRHCNPADAPQPEIFQPTLPARGATVGADVLFHPAFRISIHAPRTGSDSRRLPPPLLRRNFNPRSPHGERPLTSDKTPSAFVYFNPRSPHGERRANLPHALLHCTFQSTLPARGATIWTNKTLSKFLFQSTLPARGATTAPLR